MGNEGADFAADEQLVFATVWATAPHTTVGWYGFKTLNEVVCTDVVFLNKAGSALTLVPTWEDETLPAGTWVPSGRIGEDDAYISSITITGSIMLYKD